VRAVWDSCDSVLSPRRFMCTVAKLASHCATRVRVLASHAMNEATRSFPFFRCRSDEYLLSSIKHEALLSDCRTVSIHHVQLVKLKTNLIRVLVHDLRKFKTNE
jgi:hypothetical protein